jgi:hypothetical protein
VPRQEIVHALGPLLTFLLVPPNQRPLGSLRNVASIDVAPCPSFSLFNQSFDSLADGAYFPVDNDSFGMGRSSSLLEPDAAAQVLRPVPSIGNNSQQLLNPSASGPLTIGYSPANSFGAPSIAPSGSMAGRGGAGTTLLMMGGTDSRIDSPTQVLERYGSYSMSRLAPALGSLEESQMRMSTSFGGNSISYARSYGVEPGASPTAFGPQHQPMERVQSSESNDKDPSFYLFLRKYKAAFKDCVFLLPGVKAALLEAPLTDGKSDGSDYGGVSDPTSVCHSLSHFESFSHSNRSVIVSRRG